eukprot:jgi/Mesen1/6412/ME000329S05575
MKRSIQDQGPQLDKSIRAIASWKDYTYAANGRHIAVFVRAHQVATWSGHDGKIVQLLTFGNHILSLGADRRVCVWSAEKAASHTQPEHELQLAEDFTPTCMMHPDTYLNKIVIGGEEGRLQLWNISSGRQLYEFKGWGSPVRCCVSSPALDVVAVGCADGRVHLHNLKFDETVVSFSHEARGPVTALSFRTGGTPGGLRVTEQVWIFDSDDGEARLLRFRSGHSAPPTCIQYYGNGRHILSAGQDRAFRVFSTIQDQQSRELSQGHVAKRAKKLKLKEEELKLSRVVAFAAAEIRERDWCNVITCHEGDPAAYTWRLRNFVIGDHILRPVGGDPTPVKACAISACGNFGIVGTAAGRVERFNLQSGMHRGTFQSAPLQYSGAHAGAIVGLGCDSTNTHLVSGGYDGLLKVWDMKSAKLKATMAVGSPLVKMVFHRVNGLAVVASDDMVIRVYDVAAARLVRKFQGHADRITDMCLSGDGRWLLSAAMDCSVRTWDLVTARPLDAMRVGSAVTALSLSPAMDMLATTHGQPGDVAMPDVSTGVINQDLPPAAPAGADEQEKDGHGNSNGAEKEGGEGKEEEKEKVEREARAREDEAERRDQLEPELITLAMLPRAHWQGLVNLDVIKERNKPIEAPKKAEQAPFFLPTLPTFAGDTVFAPATPKEGASGTAGGPAAGAAAGAKSRVKKGGSGEPPEEAGSRFTRLLRADAGLVEYLRTLSPSAIDLELRMMEIVDDEDAPEDDVRQVAALLDFLVAEVASKRNFELVQALVQRTLTIHGEAIARFPLLREKARALLERQRASWQKLDDMFQQVRCMVAFFSGTQQ